MQMTLLVIGVFILLIDILVLLFWQRRRVRGDWSMTFTGQGALLGEELARQLVPALHGRVPGISGVSRRFEHGLKRFSAMAWEDVSPAIQWEIDNAHLAREALEAAGRTLGRREMRRLPAVHYQGARRPRIYVLALIWTFQSDRPRDGEGYRAFLEGFQSQRPLTMQELWLFPMMLRLALCRQLAALGAECARDLRHIRRAARDVRLHRFRKRRLTPGYLEYMLRQLNRQGVHGVRVIRRMERWMLRRGTEMDAMIQFWHQRQVRLRLTASSSIEELRFLSQHDWERTFERVSEVERILREDPAGLYECSDDMSRALCREEIERLSRRLEAPEDEIARAAVDLAQAAEGEKQRHVGWYLFEGGRARLFERWPDAGDDRYFPGQRPAFEYRLRVLLIFGILNLLAFAFLCPACGLGAALLLTLLGALSFWSLAQRIVQWVYARVFPARPPLRLELRDGLTAQMSTAVVMPVLLRDERQVRTYFERLETHYLGNADPQARFVLLGDFTDGDQAQHPQDREIIAAGRAEADRLNGQYAQPEQPVFYFLCRKRTQVPASDSWMGWERKRGALMQFNHMLLGGQWHGEAYPNALRDMQYVVTLDADTILPRGALRPMIGTLAHPLNKPVVEHGRVVEGYGLAQPRMVTTLSAAAKAPFARLFGGRAGLDAYAGVGFEAYQDIFGEGSFIGKGAYHVQTFMKVLDGVIPEQTVLSHDLLEGSFARVGYLSDVELFDGAPGNPLAYQLRQHRWTRGDWQLLPFLGARFADAKGEWIQNPLPGHAKWKIWENLLRSLAPVANLALIIGGLLLGRWQPPVLTLVWFIPAFWATLKRLFYRVGDGLAEHWAQAVASYIMLPSDALNALDAILRSLSRMWFSRRRMLEWMTADDAERSRGIGLVSMARGFWINLLLGSVCLAGGIWGILDTKAALGIWNPGWSTALFGVLWLLGIPVMRLLARPHRHWQPDLAQRRTLRRLSRKTYAFFQDMVGPNTGWLPPDNLQQSPGPVLAQRTSPTNIGFALMAEVCALELGYLPPPLALARLEGIIGRIGELDKWRGHLYNWYETISGGVLQPQYVSLVDSGNLAASLLVVQSVLERLGQCTALPSMRMQGLLDTALLAMQEQPELEPLCAQLERAQSLEGIVLELPSGKHGPWTRKLSALWEQWRGYEQALGGQCVQNPEATLGEIARTDSRAEQWLARARVLAGRCAGLIGAMDFMALYDEKRNLFAIGYDVGEGRRSDSYYDLLASEARLSSFLTIARGEVPDKHWKALGRPLGAQRGGALLLSWSGTMFEYGMPGIWMDQPEGSLLRCACRAAVRAQRHYGRRNGMPWGISESGYYAFDPQRNYQYKAFGVPQAALKAMRSREQVIAPYATILALQTNPEAMGNLRALFDRQAEGDYGLYEALDFTSSRQESGRKFMIVRSFMAHHQGMILAALTNILCGQTLRRSFMDNPQVRTVEHLLQERAPGHVRRRKRYESPQSRGRTAAEARVRALRDPVSQPESYWMSNGHYHCMITSLGSGRSGTENIVVNRCRTDRPCAPGGWYIYIRNRRTSKWTSPTAHPLEQPPQDLQVRFGNGQAVFSGREGALQMTLEVCVCPEEDVEVRRLTLHNRGRTGLLLDVCSMLEPVLARENADLAHPAFSNLFIQSEYMASHSALLVHRRPRMEPSEEAHMALVWADPEQPVGYETSREAFIGRGHDLNNPQVAVTQSEGRIGATADPVSALRQSITIPAGQRVQIRLSLCLGKTREETCRLLERYARREHADRAFVLAGAYAQIERGYLGGQPGLYQRVGGYLCGLNAQPDAMRNARANHMQQTDLWALGVSGDWPIMLLRVDHPDQMSLAEEVLRAHAYLTRKGLRHDLVIMDAYSGGYARPVRERLLDLLTITHPFGALDQPGGVMIRDQATPGQAALLCACAGIVFSGSDGTMREQLARMERRLDMPKPPLIRKRGQSVDYPVKALPSLPLFNPSPMGGFSADGREYVIEWSSDCQTPAPWCNVLANPNFGTMVSERGAGYTWFQNSREQRLTPWYNDPVSDPASEMLYLRDEDGGRFWSALPAPGPAGAFRVRHGLGYSVFEQYAHGLEHRLSIAVDPHSNVKVYTLRLYNSGPLARTISLTMAVRWCLGSQERDQRRHLVLRENRQLGWITVANHFSPVFRDRLCYMAAPGCEIETCLSLSAFMGGRPPDKPLGMLTRKLPEGGGDVPGGVLRIKLTVPPGGEAQAVLLLGVEDSEQGVFHQMERFAAPQGAQEVMADVERLWERETAPLRIRTPERAMDDLVNFWLPYQTLVSRLWGRTGFYQSGGAFGFRDQLQDVLSMLDCNPQRVREQILLCAAHQYPQGDVQHWWHPPRYGVRTRMSDDLVFLVFAALEYVEHTGDDSILRAEAAYLDGPEIPGGCEDWCGTPEVTSWSEPLYAHCLRALRHAASFGAHGLPLMGTGDWNDAMSAVGREGRGESVWLGFFLLHVLERMIHVARRLDELEDVDWLERIALSLRESLEQHAWDGGWYLRAFFDNGAPMGSADNAECRIDGLSQAWSVIAGMRHERSEAAMNAVREHLLDERHGLLRLFTPAFSQSTPDPGYIRGYVPGVRENGGQYTHAAAWMVQAWAILGQHDLAMQTFLMLMPSRHTQTHEGLERYRVEPYVYSADIYDAHGMQGRGGWTWYTGAAGWMRRVAVEWLLGLKRRGDVFAVQPRIPQDWPGFEIFWNTGSGRYHIQVIRGASDGCTLDGASINPECIPIEPGEHEVVLLL